MSSIYSIDSDELSESQLHAIQVWIDSVPLSRQKKNISRDFSDGVLLAEVIHAYIPSLVDLNNYRSTGSIERKIINYEMLNDKVFKKMRYKIPIETINNIVNCKPEAIEKLLNIIQFKIAEYRDNKQVLKNKYNNNSLNISTQSTPFSQSGYEDNSTFNNSKLKKSPIINSISSNDFNKSISSELLIEKECEIRVLLENVDLLNLKVAKLENMIRIKDNQIASLIQDRN
jgi:hypothetical protein